MKKRKAVRGERKTAGRLFAVKILQLADISAQRLFIEYDAVRKIYSGNISNHNYMKRGRRGQVQ